MECQKYFDKNLVLNYIFHLFQKINVYCQYKSLFDFLNFDFFNFIAFLLRKLENSKFKSAF